MVAVNTMFVYGSHPHHLTISCTYLVGQLVSNAALAPQESALRGALQSQPDAPAGGRPHCSTPSAGGAWSRGGTTSGLFGCLAEVVVNVVNAIMNHSYFEWFVQFTPPIYGKIWDGLVLLY